MIGNKQKSIEQDYWAINKRNHIYNLRSFFSCPLITEGGTWALFYFCSSIDFLPAWCLFTFFSFFWELLKNSFFNIFPEAPTFLRLLRGTKTQKELSTLDQGWFLKHFPFQTPIYPEKCLVRRRPPGALGGRGLREHNPCDKVFYSELSKTSIGDIINICPTSPPFQG